MAKKSKRLSAKRVIALITAFLFVLSGMPLSSISAQAAVKKPTIAKSATLKVGTSKTIKISKGSYKIVSVKVSSSKKSVATVKASGKAAIKVTGKKAGKATITTRVKAKKGKTSKTFKLTTKVTVKKATKPEPTVDTSKTVNTQDELVAALADSSITQITIGQDATSITIPAGDYSKVDLIVDAPNASIVNNGTFKSITIKAVAANTWTEKGKGNRITTSSKNPVHIIIETLQNVASLMFKGTSSQQNLVEIKSGTVGDIAIVSAEPVKILTQGTSKIENVEVQSAANVNVTVSDTAEVSKVEVTGSGANVGINTSDNAKIDSVDVASSANSAAVNVKAEGSSSIKEVTTSAANSVTNVTANGSADVAKVAVNGSADASIGGTSNKVTEVDIKGASKDAVVTVTTTTVKIEAAAGTDNEKIINNQSGKALATEVTQSDGTKKETTTATDTTTPSSGGGSTGGGSGSSAVSVASVTISGQPTVGQTLSATLTPSNATNKSSYNTWKWQRSLNGTDWKDIDGAESQTYTVTTSDRDNYLRVIASGTGVEAKTSTASAKVAGWTVSKPSNWDAAVAHGDIAFSATTAAAGTIITVTATPDDDYGLATVTVNGSETGVTLVGNTATFAMPTENAVVGATFAETGTLKNTVAIKNGSDDIESAFKLSTEDEPYTGFDLTTIKTDFEVTATAGNVNIAYALKGESGYTTVTAPTVPGTYKVTITVSGASSAYKAVEPIDGYVSLAKATASATVTRTGKVDAGTYAQSDFLALFTTTTNSDGAKTWSLKKGSNEYATLGTSVELEAGATYTLKLAIAESDDYEALVTPVETEFTVKADDSTLALARSAAGNPEAGTFTAAEFKALFEVTATTTGEPTWSYKLATAENYTDLEDSDNTLSAGTYTVKVAFAADKDYNAAVTTASLTVTKATATATVTRSGKVDAGTYAQSDFLALFTTTTNSDGTKTWSLKKGSNDYVALGTSVELEAGATYTLKLEIAASDDYEALAEAVETSFTVKADDEITFARNATENPAAGTFTAEQVKGLFTLTKTTDGEETWSYKLATDDDYTALADSGNELGAGTYTVKVAIAATADYNAAEKTASLTVTKATATATVARTGKVDAGTYAQTDFLALFTTTANSNGTKTWSLKKGSDEYAALGTNVELEAGATYTLKLAIAESDDYEALATPVETEFTVKADDSTLALARAAGENPEAGTFTAAEFKALFEVTAATTGEPTWSYKLATAENYTDLEDSDNTLSAGTYTVKVAFAADKDYNAGEVTATVTVNEAPAMTITLNSVYIEGPVVSVSATVANWTEGNNYYLSTSDSSAEGALALGDVGINSETGALTCPSQTNTGDYVEGGTTYYLLYVVNGQIIAASNGVEAGTPE